MPAIQDSLQDPAPSRFTSMVDIVFLLLVFFLLQPFKQPEMRTPAELPKDIIPYSGPPKSPSCPWIVVRVTRDPGDGTEARFHIHGEVIDSASGNAGDRLAGVLRERSGGDQWCPVIIHPDLHVGFRHVVTVTDACSRLGMGVVRFTGSPLANYVPGQPPGLPPGSESMSRSQRGTEW